MAKFVVEEEKTSPSPLAVVFYGGALGKEVARELREQKLRVRHVEGKTESLPIWEKPDYILSFGPVQEAWEKARVLQVIIKGRSKTDRYWLNASAKKIVRAALATQETGIEILGEGERTTGTKSATRSIEEVLRPVARRRDFLSLVVLALVLFVLAPFVVLGFSTLTGFVKVMGSAEALRGNDMQKAKELAQEATDQFGLAREIVWLVPSDRFFNFLSLGEKSADLVSRAAKLLPETTVLANQILAGNGGLDTVDQAKKLALELPAIDQDMGFVEGQLGQVLTPRIINLVSFLGVAPATLRNYRTEINLARTVVKDTETLLSSLDEIIPTKPGETKTYLVIFQNSSELRPTRGFIGSYALATFTPGGLTSFKIHDIYEADGQLRGHIAPPDEILHFLGQTAWYMRDGNWAPDFPLTAKRLEWFLEKETGAKVQGVVGVNLGAVQKLLMATGPITLPDRQEQVTAANFFEKTEYAAEINFFPGSTQKPQFLAAVANGLLAKVLAGTKLDYLAVGKAVWQSMAEKDVVAYFDSPKIAEVMAQNNWGGRLGANGCGQKQANCLMLVEANLGANKANYFVKRAMRVDQVIDKAGGLETTVTIRYRNDSPNDSWPGGRYKNYLRILLPEGTVLKSLDLGDNRTATFSSLLTADVLQQVPKDQFLVFRSLEQSLGQNNTVAPAATSYGVLIEIPVQTEKTVKFVYRPAYKLDFGKTQQDFRFVFLKQPGTGADTVDLALDYPSFLRPVLDQPEENVSVLALPQKLIYNMDLSKDRVIEVNFKR